VGPVLSRVAYVVVALAVLVSAGLAHAGVSPFWPELGGSASGNGVSQTPSPKAVSDGSVAVGGDGRPVVVYTEYPDPTSTQGAITVKRWTGSAWEILTEPGGLGPGHEPQVQISSSGAIHVAWLTEDGGGNTVRLRVRTGATFDPLGTSDSPGGISGTNAGIIAPFSLALTPDGKPIVAFLGFAETGILDGSTPAIVDSTVQIYVRRWTGTVWEFVGGGFTGTDGFSGGGASNARSFTSSLGAIRHHVDTPSLAVNDDGEPVVAFTYFTVIAGVPAVNTDVYVTRWNGSAWRAVGPAVPAADGATGRGGAGGVSASSSGSFNPSLAADATGKLALAWEEQPASGGVYVWVRTWNGTTWAQLANSATGSGFTPLDTINVRPRVGIDSAGRPIVAWAALTAMENPTQIFVRRWNGATAWEELGFHSAREAGISDAALDALAPALALTPSGGAAVAGTPTIAWLDVQETGSGQVFLRQLFSGTTFALTTRVSGSGALASDPIGVQCTSGTCVRAFPSGTAVTLLPQATSGSTFVGWADGCTGSGPCTVVMTAPRSVNASFVGVHALALAVATPAGTSGQGTVGSVVGPAGTCLFGGSLACVSDVLRGTPVILQAAPEPGNRFLSWSGGPCNGRTNATCPFTMTANVSTTALFRAVTGVRVLKAGNGAGTVTGTGISCGNDCFQEVFTGTSVTLTPVAATGSSFLGWAGDPCTTLQANGACVLSASGLNRSVTATFQLIPYTVTMLPRPNGIGATTNTLPDPISCGAGNGDCTATLDFGTRVVLQATPITGSRFVSWSGTACNGSTNATCAFRIPAANVSVSPRFRDVTTLTLNKAGQGTVTSTPAGIACGLACTTASFDFARGILVKLNPTPAIGWKLDGFFGACSGATCSVNASAPTALVGVNFSIQQRRLTVTVSGQGGVSGPGVACDTASTPCALDFDYGTSLPLMATAAAGHRFIGWMQSCTGVGVCNNLMTVNRSVTATFKPEFGLTVTRQGNSTGTITSSPAGITCGADCSGTYLGGTLVTLTRSEPIVSTTFRWGGDCAFRGTNATCALRLNANASVAADYSLKRLGLTVVKVRPLLGTVTGLGGGIDCGDDCTEVVNYGTPVTLIAAPSSSPAAEFVSWTGCATAASNASCSFAMTANRTVKATFRPLVSSVEVKTLSSGSTLPVGGSRQLSAVATFTDGSRQDVTTRATWAPGPAVTPLPAATVNTTGLVTGRTIGSTSVTATFRGHAGELLIHVDTLQTTGSPISVSCHAYGDSSPDPSPQLACLPSGVNFSVHCKATGVFTSHGPQDVTDQVTWLTSNATFAQSTGLVAFKPPIHQSFRIVGNGTAILRATLGGKTSPTTGRLGIDPWVVQGVASTVSAIQVTPGEDIVGVGATLPLQALATVSSAAPACATPPTPTRDFSTIVTWTSSAEHLADVSFFGEVTGIAQGGPVTITATYPRVNKPSLGDTASITVGP
jgi:hypothetical protein